MSNDEKSNRKYTESSVSKPTAFDNDLNFEFRYKHDEFITKRLFNRIEKLSFDIPKEEKITAIFADLYWGNSDALFMFIFLPLLVSGMTIGMTLGFGTKSFIAIFSLPILYLISGLLYILKTKTLPLQILLFTDKSINLIYLMKKNSNHHYLPYERVSNLSVKGNEISIKDKSNINNIDFSMNYNKVSFIKVVKTLIYEHFQTEKLIEFKNDEIAEKIKHLKEFRDYSKTKFMKKAYDKQITELENPDNLKLNVENHFEISEELKKIVNKKIKSDKITVICWIIIGIPIILLISYLLKATTLGLVMSLVFGLLFPIIFFIVYYVELVKLLKLNHFKSNKIDIFEDRIEFRTDNMIDNTIHYEMDLIFEPKSLGIPKIRRKNSEYDEVDIYRLTDPKRKWRIGKIDNIDDFYNNLLISYINWLKNKQSKEKITRKEIFDLFINTDDFNKKLLNAVKQAIQNFLCDTKRSTYRFTKMEPIMKKVSLTNITSEPIKELKNLPIKIEIPEEVINPDCGPESEADKILTKDLLDWNLQFPKEFYQFYINDYEKILYAFHPSKNTKLQSYIYKLAFILALGVISIVLLNLWFGSLGTSISLVALILVFAIIKVFSKFDNYRREIIFTDKKILSLSYTKSYFTTYSNIEKGSKYHNKSDKILKKFVIVFKKSVRNSKNLVNRSIILEKLPLNSPIFAILSNNGISIYRSD